MFIDKQHFSSLNYSSHVLLIAAPVKMMLSSGKLSCKNFIWTRLSHLWHTARSLLWPSADHESVSNWGYMEAILFLSSDGQSVNIDHARDPTSDSDIHGPQEQAEHAIAVGLNVQ